MNVKAGYFTAMGLPISGSSDLTLRLQRDSDYFFFDFNDNAFKAAGHVALDLAMSEPDAVRAPGWYFGLILDNIISGFDNNTYTVYINCAGIDGPPSWHDIGEFRVYKGISSSICSEILPRTTIEIGNSIYCITMTQLN